MVKNKVKKMPGAYTSPCDIPYIQKLIFSLNTIGVWPHEILGQKQWFSDFRNTKMMFSYYCIALTMCVMHLIRNFHSMKFVEFGLSFTNIMLAGVMMQRICSTWSNKYKETCKAFIQKFHLFYHKDKNDYYMKIYKDIEKLSANFTYLLHFELYFGVCFYNLTPLYNSYQRGMFKTVKPINATYDQAVNYDVPFDYYTDFKGFIFVYIINCITSYDVASYACIIDTYISVIGFHVCGHLKILQHNLRSFPRPAMRGVRSNPVTNPPWYDDKESNEIKALLVNSIEHHKMIKDFVDGMSEAFGLTICVYLFYHQIVGCILLLELSELDLQAFGAFGMLTLFCFQQLMVLSIVFELIGTQSETLKDAVYEVPWECMGIKNRKIVLIYLCNVQKNMAFKAMGMVPVGVRTMASILKTTISYYMLLRTTVNR